METAKAPVNLKVRFGLLFIRRSRPFLHPSDASPKRDQSAAEVVVIPFCGSPTRLMPIGNCGFYLDEAFFLGLPFLAVTCAVGFPKGAGRSATSAGCPNVCRR